MPMPALPLTAVFENLPDPPLGDGHQAARAGRQPGLAIATCAVSGEAESLDAIAEYACQVGGRGGPWTVCGRYRTGPLGGH